MLEEKLYRAAKSGNVDQLLEALASPNIDIDHVNKVQCTYMFSRCCLIYCKSLLSVIFLDGHASKCNAMMY